MKMEEMVVMKVDSRARVDQEKGERGEVILMME